VYFRVDFDGILKRISEFEIASSKTTFYKIFLFLGAVSLRGPLFLSYIKGTMVVHWVGCKELDSFFLCYY